MLAYYLEWHLRKRLAPMLFEDDDPEGATAQRKTPVQKAEVSERAKQKAATKTTDTGLPAHSLRTMHQDLGNLTCNEHHPAQPAKPPLHNHGPTDTAAGRSHPAAGCGAKQNDSSTAAPLEPANCLVDQRYPFPNRMKFRLTARLDRRHRRPPRARPAHLASAVPEPAFAASPRGRGLCSDLSRHRPACRPSAGAHPLHAGLR